MANTAPEKRTRADREQPGDSSVTFKVVQEELAQPVVTTPDVVTFSESQLANKRYRDLVENMGEETLKQLGRMRREADSLMLNIRSRQGELVRQSTEFTESCAAAIASNAIIEEAIAKLKTYFPDTKTVSNSTEE